MADAVLYTSMDSGGPGLVSGSAVQRFYSLLYPILVTGYGSGLNAKPGQGWTLVHADLPTGFKLRSPDGVYYTFYKGSATSATNSDTSTATPGSCQIYMSESITDVAAYPPVGVNVRSMHYSADYNSANTGRHWISHGNGYDSARRPKAWWVVARGSQVLINYVTSELTDSTGNKATTLNAYGTGIFLGNPVLKVPGAAVSGPQNSMVLGGYSNDPQTTAYTYSNAGGTFLSMDFTRLRDPVTGVVESGTLSTFSGSPQKHDLQSSYKFAQELWPIDISLFRVDLWDNAYGSIGYLPGLFHANRAGLWRADYTLQSFGKAINFSETLAPVTIGGKSFYILPTPYGAAFVCLAEEYWVP